MPQFHPGQLDGKAATKEETNRSVEHNDSIFHHEALHLHAQERQKLYHHILECSLIDPEFLTMLLLSGLLALFGLLQNSVAVIIGAMLISPLMDPILSAALALLLGDSKLGRKTAIVLGLSIAAVIAVTGIVAWMVPLKEATPEILARTHPNLLDLFIAFLSGLAGTLALRSSNSSLTILPGVAIAVAVIPPLAVVGYALSTHHWTMAWGGFLLFVTNLVSIMLSAALIFRLMGFHPHEATEEGRAKFRKRMAVSALVLAVLAVPLVQTLRHAVSQVRMRSEIQTILNRGFETDYSNVSDLSFSESRQALLVRATVRTTRYFQTPQIDEVQNALRRQFGSEARLTIDQILVTQGGLSPQQAQRISDFITGGVVKPAPPPPPYNFNEARQKLVTELEKQVDEVLAGTPIQRVEPLRADLGSNPPVVCELKVVAPEPLASQTLQVLASQLSTKLSQPVELHGETTLLGAKYTLSVESKNPQTRLSQQDRQAVTQLLDEVAKQPSLRLGISLEGTNLEPKALQSSLLWREVNRLIALRHLSKDQWSLASAQPQAAKPQPPPPQAAAAPAAEKVAEEPGRVRCQFKVFQNF
jgi:uncharacterized hydrophobic protein (TIGR00271 family)